MRTTTLSPNSWQRSTFTAWHNDLPSTSKKDHFKHLQSQAQAALRRMQNEWWEQKAREVQLYSVTWNSKMFFSAIKAVYGPPRPTTTPLLSANGTLLKEKSAINERWREHFSTLLNRPSSVSNDALEQIPQRPIIDSLDFPPTLRQDPRNGRDPCGRIQGDRTSSTGDLPQHHHLHLGGRGHTPRVQ